MTHAHTQNSRTGSLSSLQSRIQRNPNDGPAWLAMAQILAQSRPGPELKRAISRSIELLPDDYQAWLLAGLEMQEGRGPTAAQQWLEHITQQHPGLAAPRMAKAQLHAAAEAEEANQLFLAIIRDFPGDSRAHLLFAEHLQNQGKVRAAGDQLEAALNINPELAENWTALAMIRLAEHRFEEVIKAADRALEINDKAIDARLTRAEAYRQAAQWKLALEDYRQVHKSMPDNPFVLMGLGACLAGEGAFDEALQQLKKALRIKPDFTEATLNIALVLASQVKPKEASKTLAPLLQQKDLEPKLRESARVTQAALQEQLRLADGLRHAAETNSLEGLQAILQQAPAILMQTSQRTEKSLRAMALASQQSVLQLPVMDYGLALQQSAFVEACLLSRTTENPKDMIRLWQSLQQHQADAGLLNSAELVLWDTWNVVLERKRLRQKHFEAGSGEAWLRYWHFRLFARSATNRPGLFKFAPNSIGLHQTTAPQEVIWSVRILLDEIYPSLPVGLGRAAFILSAINQIHAFVDGNGRTARLMFGRELELAELPPVLWTSDLRKAQIFCLDQAQYQNNFDAFREVLQQAQKATQTLFRKFSEGLASL